MPTCHSRPDGANRPLPRSRSSSPATGCPAKHDPGSGSVGPAPRRKRSPRPGPVSRSSRRGHPEALLALLLMALTPLGLATQAPNSCPDRSAAEVRALVTESSIVHECDGGIELAWIHVSWDGTQCPDWQVAQPAHQTCADGAALPGHRCVASGILPVERRSCQCDESNVLGGLIGILNKCTCSDWLPAGHVEDHATEACRKP